MAFNAIFNLCFHLVFLEIVSCFCFVDITLVGFAQDLGLVMFSLILLIESEYVTVVIHTKQKTYFSMRNG